MNARSAASIRYALALMFLWFGVQQLIKPGPFVGFLPEWSGYIPMPGEMIVKLNGLFEVVAGLMFLAGSSTRLMALLLGAHLMGIAASVGGAIGVRDAALAVATLAFAFSDADDLTLDAWFRRRQGVPLI